MQRRDFLKGMTAAGLLTSCAPALAARCEASARRHLLIAFSWGTGDLGGIGIVPGLLNLVRKADPDMQATVITMQTRGSESFEFLKGYLPRFLPGCRVLPSPFSALWASSPGSAMKAFRERWGTVKLAEFENGSLPASVAAEIAHDVLDRYPLELFQQLKRADPEAAQAFTDAGFYLYPSGTTLNFGRAGMRGFWSRGPGTDLRLSIPLFVARALKIPYGIAAQSFDAVEWPVDLVYRPLFKQARFLFCRDTDSLEYLRQRDLLNASSGFRPDSTFFFNGSDDAWAEAYLRKEGLESGGYMCVIGRFAESRGPIAGAVTPQREQQQLAKYKQLMEGWIEKTGLKVLICPEAKGEAPRLRERLYNILSPAAQQKCVCMDSFWNPDQACSVYRRSRLVVGHMHTMVFALSVGTPVLHIPYAEAGRKSRMIADVGLADWLLDIDETPAEAIVQAALSIHQNHDAARQRVQQSLRLVERLGQGMMAEVKAGWRS